MIDLSAPFTTYKLLIYIVGVIILSYVSYKMKQYLKSYLERRNAKPINKHNYTLEKHYAELNRILENKV